MRKLFSALVLATTLVPFSARADDLRLPKDASEPLQLLVQARQLATYARTTRKPLALIVAAEMIRDAGLEPRGTSKIDDPNSTKALVDEARGMARRDRLIARLADNVLATNEKGRETGPLYEITKVEPGATERRANMPFKPGKRAEVYVEGSGKLAITVYDAKGQPLCKDDHADSVAYCWWQQANQGDVTVEVMNPGKAPNTIRIVTN